MWIGVGLFVSCLAGSGECVQTWLGEAGSRLTDWGSRWEVSDGPWRTTHWWCWVWWGCCSLLLRCIWRIIHCSKLCCFLLNSSVRALNWNCIDIRSMSFCVHLLEVYRVSNERHVTCKSKGGKIMFYYCVVLLKLVIVIIYGKMLPLSTI